MTTPNDDDEEKKSFDELSKDLLNYLKKQTGSDAIITVQGPFKTNEIPNLPQPQKEQKPFQLEFNYTPKEIKEYLDQFVIQQDEAKKVLSIAICDHFNHVKNCIKNQKKCTNYQKQNVLMIGPTGVGKTYLIKCISDLIGVPFVKSDATKFTETGYVGGDVEDLVRQLVSKANQNIQLAEYGIIYLDEIDKIASSSMRLGKDVSGRGVQSNLLKLMEETEVPLKTPWDIHSQIKFLFQKQQQENPPETINTKHILFIVSGAFDSLDEITRKRVEGSKFGFNSQSSKSSPKEKILHQVATEDLIKFGFESEFVGRLPVRVVCDPLTQEDLFKILKESKGSIMHQYSDAFKSYGIDTMFLDVALREMARLASKEKTGARGLTTIFEQVFRNFKFELPSTKISTFLISREVILNPKKNLSKMLRSPLHYETKFYDAKINHFEHNYYLVHQIHLSFNNALRNEIISSHKNEQKPIEELCQNVITKLGYGIELLSKNPHKHYVITPEIIENIDRYIEKWVKESFKTKAV